MFEVNIFHTFTPCSSVFFIVNFEQLKTGCEKSVFGMIFFLSEIERQLLAFII